MKNNYFICKMEISDVEKSKLLEDELGINILSKEAMLEDIQNNNFSYFVLKETINNSKKSNDNIIGYIATSHVVDTMDILSIVIKKEYQNRGFGSMILNYIIDFARKNNIISILLEVRKSNLSAQKLYKKCNFKNINIRKNYYNNPTEDALIYLLKL